MPGPFQPGPKVTALETSAVERSLESLHAYLIELHAKVDRLDHRISHLINNQQALAIGLSRHVDPQLEQMWRYIQDLREDISAGSLPRAPLRNGVAEAITRLGDRLVPSGSTQLPGEFAFGDVGADGTVWAIGLDDSIWRWALDGIGWVRVDGALRRISCPTADQVWGVSGDDQIFRRVGDTWVQVDGALSTIAAAADGTVVGTAADHSVWRRYPESGWNQLPGAMCRIAIRSANEMIAVAPDDRLFTWNGSDWEELDGRACEVAIGGAFAQPELWCVNRSCECFRRGAQWDKIGPPKVDRVSKAGRNTLVQVGSQLEVSFGP